MVRAVAVPVYREQYPVHHVYKKDINLGYKMKSECKLAHFHWLLQGLKAYNRLGLSTSTLPVTMINFKEMFIYKQSRMFNVLDDILQYDGNNRHIIDMEEAWQAYRNDKMFIKSSTKDEFVKVFKAFAKSKHELGWQSHATGKPDRGSYAIGFTLKERNSHGYTVNMADMMLN